MRFDDDEPIVAIQTQDVSSSGDKLPSEETEREVTIEEIRLRTAQTIKEARVMADNQQLDDAKEKLKAAQKLINDAFDKPNMVIQLLKSQLQQLLELMETQEIYEKQGRGFALSCETSHDRQRFTARDDMENVRLLATPGDKGSSSRTGRIKVKIINKSEASLEETKVKVMLELTGNESGNERPGLDLVTVLDVSGSMEADGRLEKTKIAMQSVIKTLSPIDRLSVVTFSNRSIKLCPLRQMTENSQAEILNLVFNLDAGGGTNISAGLEMGLQVLNGRRFTSGRVVAIMLLCDGEQNSGGDATKVEVGNVPIYTFGFGTDYNPEVLNQIANNSAGGTFSFINDFNKLTEAFSQCLAGLLTVAVQDLKVTLRQESSTIIEYVSAGNYQQSNDVGSVTVSFGNLYEEEVRKVIVHLLLPAVSSPQDGMDVLEITHTYSTGKELFEANPRYVSVYRVLTSNEPEREELKIEEIRNKTVQSINEAREMADMQKLGDAKDMIVEAQNLLEDVVDEPKLVIKLLKSELQQLLELMATQKIYDKNGRGFALSCQTSHDRQRFAARGPSSRTKVRIINKTEAPLQETKFKVMLELTGNESGNQRPGLDLVMVLDVSGSMVGENLDEMKVAMQLVIKKLSPIDRLSVVTFSTDSYMLCPLRQITENSQEEIENVVNGIVAGGGTNITAGLETGLKVLKDRRYTSGRVVAIMLLSDGEQNIGGDATMVSVDSVPVYTIGLGAYYDPRVLNTIAKNSSGGTFTDVQNPYNLSEAFSQCLDGLLSVAVQELKVTFTQGDSTIENVSAGNYPQSKDVYSVTVLLGDLYEKELRKVIVDLLLPAVSNTQGANILQISYSYSFGGELIDANPIIVNITRRNPAPIIKEARVVTDKMLDVANKMISQIQKLHQNVVDETLKSEVQHLKNLMKSQTINNNQGRPSETSHDRQASAGQINNEAENLDIEISIDPTRVKERIPESLNWNNYLEWRESVTTYLQELKVWKVIEEPARDTIESIENDDIRTTIQKLRQFRENWMALIVINEACGFPIKLQIIDLFSARTAWETLAKLWEQGVDVGSFLNAGERGDWTNVETLLHSKRDQDRKLALKLLTARIPSSQNTTVLHLASLAGEVDIVEKLVELITKREDLEIEDNDGYTALGKASINGNTRIAKCMVKKNKKLVSIPTATKLLPVVIAVMYGNKEMASYLYSKTPRNELTNKGNINGATLLTYSIRMQLYDISFGLIQEGNNLTFALDHYGQSALYQLACTPFAFPSGSQLKVWQRWMYNLVHVPKIDWDNHHVNVSVQDEDEEDSQSNLRNTRNQGIWQRIVSRLHAVLGFKHIFEKKLLHHQSDELLSRLCKDMKSNLDNGEVSSIIDALHEAAAKGVVEVIVGVLKKLPELRRFRDKEGSTIFMKAVKFRQPEVFSLLQEFASKDKMIDLVDDHGEHILHKLKYDFVDRISSIQGAVLKMQTELQWFEKIEPMMSRGSLEKQNRKRKTAHQLFRESHKKLMIDAEKWMKETANSCIIVGVLVVTIMFAAAFTVPGGNNQDTGLPLFLHKKLFKVFIISDAVSLFSSTTSVLIFLGILSSRYAEKDFLKSLPRKMIFGLFTLFLSIATMMIAFAATLFMMLHAESRIVLPVVILSLASFPLMLYVGLLFPLLYEFLMSTFGPSIFGRKGRWSFFSFLFLKGKGVVSSGH